MNLKKNSQVYLLFFISLIAFSPILLNGFTYYSDDNYILNNPLIKSFSLENLTLIFTSYFDGHYHPLTLLSFSFNYLLSGDSPFGYQLTNLCLNALNSVLVYLLVYKIFKNQSQAFVIALLFALHPLHVESVARITERKDTLFSFFFFLSCISFTTFIETQNIKKYLLTVLFFVLSLLSKGQAVTLPITLLIISLFILGIKQSVLQLKYILPLFLISGFFGFLNLKAQQYTGYFLDTSLIPDGNNFISGAYVLTNYIFKLFIPFKLSPHYPYPFDIYNQPSLSYYLYLLIFPAILFLIYFSRKNKILLFGIIFYLVNILLMIRFIPVSENVMPDRYNYVSMLGFSVLLFYLLEIIFKKKLIIGVYVVSGLFFIKTFTQTMVWKDGIKVWETAYKYYPYDSEINQNLGSHYFSNGKIDKALKFTNKAIELDNKNILALIDRSNIWSKKQDNLRATTDLKEVLKLNVESAKDLSNQSAIYIEFGEFQKALEKNEMAVNKNPYDARLYYNQASILMLLQKYNEAIVSIDKCIELKPFYMGDALILKSRIALYNNNVNTANESLKKAKKYFVKSESIQNTIYAIENYMVYESSLQNSQNVKELNSIGLTFYNLGFYNIAIKFFEKSIQIDNNYLPSYQNLVYSNYAIRDWHETNKYYIKAINLNIKIDGIVREQLLKLEIIKS